MSEIYASSQVDRTSLLLFIKFIPYNDTKGPELYHKVKGSTTYRLWNPATASLLRRNSNSNIFSCNGSFKDMDRYDSKYTIGQNLVSNWVKIISVYWVKIYFVFAWSFAYVFFAKFSDDLHSNQRNKILINCSKLTSTATC